jgi:uncharacterized iron-regulated protein
VHPPPRTPSQALTLNLPALAAVVLLLGACTLAARGGEPPPSTPRIWHVQAQRFVSEPELVASLVASRYRLLGELHDNPAHHQARARLIAAIAAAGARPAVVFEQFVMENDEALQRAQRDGADAEALATAGRFERKSWDWPLHKPLLAAAIAAGLPVRAGNLSRATLRGDLAAAMASQDGEPWMRRLRAAPWSAEQERVLREKVVDGHCGKLPESVLPRIVLAQRARDAAMAQAVIDSETAAGAILIAGNGHVRRDIGVPAYLDAPGLRGAKGDPISVGFVEVDAEDERAAGFPRDVVADHPGFDYLWFTAPVDRDDPCERIPARPS